MLKLVICYLVWIERCLEMMWAEWLIGRFSSLKAIVFLIIKPTKKKVSFNHLWFKVEDVGSTKLLKVTLRLEGNCIKDHDINIQSQSSCVTRAERPSSLEIALSLMYQECFWMLVLILVRLNKRCGLIVCLLLSDCIWWCSLTMVVNWVGVVGGMKTDFNWPSFFWGGFPSYIWSK